MDVEVKRLLNLYIIILLLSASALINYFISKEKCRDTFVWAAWGIFTPILSLIILSSLKNINIDHGNIENDKSTCAKCDSKKEEEVESPTENTAPTKDESEEIPLFIHGPKKPLFVDVETTGLHSDDRIISICMILLNTEEIQETGNVRFKGIHYIFDPCKKSHPIAEKIHGYDDWTLRHQELFEQRMPMIQSLLEEADVVVAHNVKFDIKFIKNQFLSAGINLEEIKTICTMEEAVGSKSLKNCASDIGIYRENEIHDASEDTIMCMCLYLKERSNINVVSLFNRMKIPLQNFIVPPAAPDGPLPRRNNVKKRKEILSL
ncbi:3'-5' exonuclease [Acetobacter cerevisiae]|uniref:3'-5' exonuclease n=1 Tax=Acetobacter cerevisiae TaxID=178900 RepID=UPI000AFC88D1|nr:3'-5' exonuclease [Acetobacter cerevisiae]